MGKIVKFCTACDEGFAEKFSFCPNCASELSAFEMKPVAAETKTAENAENTLVETESLDVAKESKAKEVSGIAAGIVAAEKIPEVIADSSPVEEAIPEPVAFEADDEEDLMVEEFESGAEKVSEPSISKAAVASSPVTTLFGADGIPERTGTQSYTYSARANDDYGVTVVNESAGSLRKSLMLGASALVLTVAFGGMLYSIFNHPFFVAAIGDDDFLPPIIELTPTQVEEEKPKEANDKDSGGGGGGGTERKVQASRGELPSQTRDPIPPPMPVERMNNPDVAVVNKTEGDIIRKRSDRMGIPNGLPGSISGGTGSGGGFGSGRGTGVGSGRGTGEGSGIGSGSGSGRGDGNGGGRGSGRKPKKPVAKPKPRGPSVGLKIRSKPRPGYTDAARQNNVQGTVMLRVTFMANGRIGKVAAVKGLPHGLTRKAIAAARQIRFTAAKRNGVPYSITKRIQYNFTIY